MKTKKERTNKREKERKEEGRKDRKTERKNCKEAKKEGTDESDSWEFGINPSTSFDLHSCWIFIFVKIY